MRFLGCLLSLVLLGLPGLVGSQARSAWLGFRNDTQGVAVIQTGTLTANRFVPGAPQRLASGETSWEWVAEGTRYGVRINLAGQIPAGDGRCLPVEVGKLDALYAVRLRRLPNGQAAVVLERVWEGKRKNLPGGK